MSGYLTTSIVHYCSLCRDTKLNIAINSTDKKLSITEWSRLVMFCIVCLLLRVFRRLFSLLNKWVDQIQSISRLLTASGGVSVSGTGAQTRY